MTRVPAQDKRKMALRVALLRTLYVAGALTMVALAPKTSRLLTHLDRAKKRRTDLYRRIAASRSRLKHEGLVAEREDGLLRLTKRGVSHIERILLYKYRVPEQALWDGRWRVIFFDIREKRRSVREQLRSLLRGAGFVRLQDSVWVYPYPCDEFVALVRAHLASGVGELRVVVAEAIESDRVLREHFNLA